MCELEEAAFRAFGFRTGRSAAMSEAWNPSLGAKGLYYPKP